MHHRQMRIKFLPKVPTWRLERGSNPRPSGRKASTLPMCHHVQQFICIYYLQPNYEHLSIVQQNFGVSNHMRPSSTVQYIRGSEQASYDVIFDVRTRGLPTLQFGVYCSKRSRQSSRSRVRVKCGMRKITNVKCGKFSPEYSSFYPLCRLVVVSPLGLMARDLFVVFSALSSSVSYILPRVNYRPIRRCIHSLCS